MDKKEEYLTTAPKEKLITIENGTNYPNKRNVVGRSVDGHKALEEANIMITGEEIKQQNENL